MRCEEGGRGGEEGTETHLADLLDGDGDAARDCPNAEPWRGGREEEGEEREEEGEEEQAEGDGQCEATDR